MIKNLLRVFAALLLALLATAGLSSAAQGAGDLCPDPPTGFEACGGGGGDGGDGDDGGDVPVPGDGGNGGGDNGGGGGDNDEGNPQHRWVSFTARVDFRDPPVDSWSTAHVLPYAEDSCEGGNNVIGADVSYSRLYAVDTDSYVAGAGGFRRDGVTCIRLGITRTNHTCVLKVDLAIEKTTNPNRGVLAEKTVTKGGWSSGDSVKACDRSSVFGVLSEDITEMGRYRADAVVYYRNIVAVRTHDPINDTTTTEVDERGSYETTRTMYAQKTCAAGADGFRVGTRRSDVFVGDWTWTHADCGAHTDPDPVRYTCAPANASLPARSVNGTARSNASLFRDGEPNNLTWNVLRPTGSAFRANGTAHTRFYRNADGTPWKESKADPLFLLNISTAKNNRLAKNETYTSWLANGPHATAYVRGYWASQADKPTDITPVWRYQGTLTLRVPDQLSFNTETNEWEVVSWRNERIESTATCEGPRIRLNFVRAVSTR